MTLTAPIYLPYYVLIDCCMPTCTCTHAKLSKTSFFLGQILNPKMSFFLGRREYTFAVQNLSKIKRSFRLNKANPGACSRTRVVTVHGPGIFFSILFSHFRGSATFGLSGDFPPDHVHSFFCLCAHIMTAVTTNTSKGILVISYLFWFSCSIL
jgi:hypothetical protein